MIVQAILNIFHSLLSAFLASLPAWPFSVTSNQPIMAMIRYLSAVSNIVPVTEAVLPIFVIQTVLLTFFLGRRIVVIVFNAVRGAGLR